MKMQLRLGISWAIAAMALMAGAVGATAKTPMVDVMYQPFADKAADGTVTARWTWISKVPACVSPSRVAAGDGRRHGSWNYKTMGLLGFEFPGALEASNEKLFPSLVTRGIYELVLPPSTPISARFSVDNQGVYKDVPISQVTKVQLYTTALPASFVRVKKGGKRVRVWCRKSRLRGKFIFPL